MRVNLLAKRYARALFDLSLEMKQEEKVAADMRLVGKVLDENRSLRRVMAKSGTARRQKGENSARTF